MLTVGGTKSKAAPHLVGLACVAAAVFAPRAVASLGLTLRCAVHKLIPTPAATEVTAEEVALIAEAAGLDGDAEVVAEGPLSGGLTSPVNGVTVGSTRVVVKTLPQSSMWNMLVVGTAREALFYDDLVPLYPGVLGRRVPTVYAASGSMTWGTCRMVMQRISTESAATLVSVIGDRAWDQPQEGSEPAGWVAYTASHTPVQAMCRAVQAVGAVHAAFWGDAALADVAYLRGAVWTAGAGRGEWELIVQWARNGWAAGRAEIVRMGRFERLVAVMDASLAGASWSKMQAALQRLLESGRYTLTHGDFHGANVFMPVDDDAEPLMYDWAVVGVGSPASDVTQMMISDVKPEHRRSVEREVVAAWHASLGLDDDTYAWADAWADYRSGWGVGRWVWLMGVLGGYGLPPPVLEWFCTQLNEFLLDDPDHDLEYLVHCM